MFKVETYQNPGVYFRSLDFQADELHLTAAITLCNFLKNMAKAKKLKTKIFTYQRLQEILYPEWNMPLTQIRLASLVRQQLKELAVDFGTAARDLENNIDELVYGFRYAVEAGAKQLVPPEHNFIKETIFQQLFERLIQDKQVSFLLEQHKNKDVRHLYKALGVPSLRVIYVYQMYRVTAPIMLFFHRCRNWGIPVVFRIPYYQQYPNLSRGWRDLYETITQQSSADWSLPEKTKITRGTRFIAFVEGKDIDEGQTDDLSMELLTFNSPVHFRRHMTAIANRPAQRQMQYASPNADLLNKSMRDIINPATSEISLFDYPFGKFFFYLYECNRQGVEIKLNYEVYLECLTSGWIISKGMNGKQALSLLRVLEPYMEGVDTITEIKDRLVTLDRLTEVGKTFDDLARDEVQRNHTKRYLTNPFRSFSYLLARRYPVTVKQLQELTLVLERILLAILPDGSNAVSLKGHLEKLLQLWRGLKEQGHNLFPDGVAAKLEQALLFPVPNDWQVRGPEIRNCLAVLFSWRPAENDLEPVEKYQIHNIEQLDGLILDTEKLHITDLSINSLIAYHQRNKNMLGNLTHSWLKKSFKQSYPPGLYKLHCHCLWVDHVCQQHNESFLKFTLFNTLSFYSGKKLTISWIKGLHENDDASVFYDVLSSLYRESGFRTDGHPGENNSAEIDSFLAAVAETASAALGDKQEKTSLQVNFPALAWLDLDFCPRKFFYSNVLRPHPCYESDFHQRIVFGVIGSLLVQQANGWEGVRKFLFPLFPQWPEALKENLIRTSRVRGIRDYMQFQNVSYPKAMSAIQRLYARYARGVNFKIKNAYNRGAMKERDWLKEFNDNALWDDIKPLPGQHCGMCPHQLYCKEGEYAIDRNAGTS